MAAYNKFNLFTQDMADGVHNFKTGSAAVYKALLTNTAPVATNHLYSDISANELASGAGYTTGGATLTITDSSSSGTETVSASAASPTWTASGSMGPFRYVVVYRSDDTNKELVCWFDFGSSITMASGDTFTISFPSGLFTDA